jgi:hypothetical protein
MPTSCGFDRSARREIAMLDIFALIILLVLFTVAALLLIWIIGVRPPANGDTLRLKR